MSAEETGISRLLLIDDDLKLCRLISGREGLARAAAGGFEAIILDVMLPGMNGHEVLRQLRHTSTVPVLMLTALGDEADRISGLEMGADDYLPKTFSMRELLARLRAVTRRARLTSPEPPENEADKEISVQELKIQPASRRALLAGQQLTLTPVEYDLLLCLARSADRVVSREQMLGEITDRNYEVFDRSIDVHVSSLRRKLGDEARNPRYIRTVRSAGYM
ncbi:MAG: DNA-binding response regulator, partial [Acidobacteria bacterium]|nr:DNA-binding response regulator [Acidobacteriota bacterium]